MEKLFIGFDCHRETHYCVAIQSSGKQILSFEIANTFEEINNCSKQFITMLEEYEIIIGVEGSRNFGLHLANQFQLDNFEVLEISSNLTRSRRRTTWGSGKSDEIDALIIARALRDEYDKLSVLNYDDATEVLIRLNSRREDLVAMRSIELRRLHCFLAALTPEYKKRGDILNKRTRAYWLSYCKRNILKSQDAQEISKLQCIKNLLYTISFLNQSIETIEVQLKAAKTREVEILMSLPGIGLISACRIIACIGNIKRFKNADKLAAYAGLSPVTFASGKSSKHMSNIRGHRKLNSYLYFVALTACRCDPVSKKYYEKKFEDGKTRKQAIRYLAKRLTKVIFAMLSKNEFYNYDIQIKKDKKILTS